MNALVLTDYLHLQLQHVPTPEPGPDEVLIRIAACGICGSDVHGFDGSSGRRIPPIIMGHEGAGTIAGTGSAVTGWKIGDRVTFDSTLYCGKCDFCRRGEVNLCDSRQVIGVSCADYRRNGAFAEYVIVPARVLYRLPPELPFTEAAMIEAVSVALHAVTLSGFSAGQTALVIGAGMIGTLIVQALRIAGASHILAADLDPTRLEEAARSGAHTTIHPTGGTHTATKTLTLYPGGVDHVFEAVGGAPTVKQAISSVRKGGVVTLVGNIARHVEIPLQTIVTRQIRLQGSAASSGEYPRAIQLLASKQIDVRPLISAVEPLSKGAEAFQRLHSREPNLIKIILTPDV
ncbi:MAG TPA: galactitol-1-phosphate 5-dehydrogenase [Acidobacteriaceae bacterium]|nr:galactitol-1-phosphate 5-dehydrogenase [Acidobacteriaceae bacterium]